MLLMYSVIQFDKIFMVENFIIEQPLENKVQNNDKFKLYNMYNLFQ